MEEEGGTGVDAGGKRGVDEDVQRPAPPYDGAEPETALKAGFLFKEKEPNLELLLLLISLQLAIFVARVFMSCNGRWSG